MFHPGFSLTFFITGHGPLRANLFRLGLSDSDLCACGRPETSLHVLRECCRLRSNRSPHDLLILMDLQVPLSSLCSPFSKLAACAAEAVFPLNARGGMIVVTFRCSGADKRSRVIRSEDTVRQEV
ncbi:hypothetical protein HHI36_023757 [Cryptolaemus montrouzieri]|uniref:Tick transposon n=1 Tax=Cryptolaemus montrouzieri TaxID=559131 RepID=A0ABD2PHD6_9CUCU